MLEKLKIKRLPKSRSLTATLAIAFVALSLVALVVASGLQLYFNFRTQQEVVAGKQRLIAQEAARKVQSFIQERFSELEAAVKLGELRSTSVADREQSLEKLMGFQPSFRQLVLVGTVGQVVGQTSRLSQATESEVTDRFEAELLAQTGQGERYIGPVYIDEVTYEPLIVLAVPVQDVFGDYQGTLVAEVNLKFMWDLVDQLEIGKTGEAYVVDRQGKLLAFSNDVGRVLADENVSHLAEVAEFVERADTLAELDESSTPISTGINGGQVVATYIPLGTPDWAVVTEWPVGEVYQDVINNIVTSGAIILIVAVLAAVAGGFLARRLAVPLLNLTNTATRITEGEIDLTARVEGPTEVATLAAAFNSMTAQLRDFIGSLEDQVRARTIELALSLEVGQRASAIRDLDELLSVITVFIRDAFDLDNVYIYFVDDVGQNVIFRGGTSQAVQQLLARRHHSLPVGPGSIVGQVAATGQPVMVSDIETSDIHKPNPLLPNTRSELAVPLMAEGRVIGVLDMQSDQADTFTEANLAAFEAMATQLAISIDSAHQWSVAQEAQQRTEELIKQLTHETWADRLARKKQEVGFVYDLSAIKPISQSNGETAVGGLSAPLVVQNQPIGRLAVDLPADRAWTEAEQDLLTAVAQQLAQKAEALRLFEQTQERVTREQVARQITDRIRTSRDIETALRIATEELSKALGTSRAVVDLKVTEMDDDSNGNS